MTKLTENYGSLTFSDDVMKERVPKSIYEAFHTSLDKGEPLSKEVATSIANAMKLWATECGATHYTHWFLPMTGLTAEKHDAFLEPTSHGKAILEFSGKNLRKGEPDASSFPSGGLRATFEARGYTAWDCTSPAFIKDKTLCIPTLFCAYTGEALDKKTPLLRSLTSLSQSGTRLMHALGLKDVHSVSASVGAEQEYFLVDEKYYQERLDLRFTGRTLFGAMPPKGQEMGDHYFGALKPRVSAFMHDLDDLLWKYGIPSKTKHNEVAPAQHEVACVYGKVSIVTDNNYLLMESLQRIAKKHGLVCLLHEKPFAGVNGSGKHNNWSITTDTGINLFNPGKEPEKNIPFLAALACTIKAIDDYADILRMTISSAGNDHRLGGHEAPPAIMSIFLGSELEMILNKLVTGEKIKRDEMGRFDTGVSVIPTFSRDNTDRNRTSPFAFTGNKFEFRAVGSSQSLAGPNVILNTMISEVMDQMADLIEGGMPAIEAIKKFIKEHQRIIFNGDGYSQEWKEEARRRGLNEAKDTIEALASYIDEKNVTVLEKHHVLSRVESRARYEIHLDRYIKTVHTECLTALRMAKTQYYPACIEYLSTLADTALKMEKIGSSMMKDTVYQYSQLVETLNEKIKALETVVKKDIETYDAYHQAVYWRDEGLEAMLSLRKIVDQLEAETDIKAWPVPTYIDLLYGV